jgi:hypothetical protein
MSNRIRLPQEVPLYRVDVLEDERSPADGRHACVIGRHIKFSTEALESYCFANWQPVVYDLLVLAAALEFADKSCVRPNYAWGRKFDLELPVHDLALWQSTAVAVSLREALEFLTGDTWTLSFRRHRAPLDPPHRNELLLPTVTTAVIPYSDGLDSRAVAALIGAQLKAGLVRVRLGSANDPSARVKRLPFAAIPYKVSVDVKNREGSGRSRGFKFTLVAGIAAYLAGAQRVVMPESAQGALGGTLVPVAYAYEDYRNHPLFTARMTRFLRAVLGSDIGYEFPRLWHTKAETVRASLEFVSPGDLLSTRTCWQQSRQVSVDHHRRQCGVCAACLLRRMSLHAAGIDEPAEAYVWENLSAPEFKSGAAPAFNPKLNTGRQREYAIAAVLHLEHMAELNQSPVHAETLAHNTYLLAQSIGHPLPEVTDALNRVLDQHRNEWNSFKTSIGADSFMADWFAGERP